MSPGGMGGMGPVNSGVGQRTLSVEGFSGLAGLQPQVIYIDRSTVVSNENVQQLLTSLPGTAENQDLLSRFSAGVTDFISFGR